MRRMKLNPDALAVQTFSTAPLARTRSGAGPVAMWTEGLSFCLLECGTETISADYGCSGPN
jgi:hypothetical protein